MPATVVVNENNGAGPTKTVKSGGGTVRFKAVDNATVDTNDPLVIPATGTDYSFEKNLRLECTVAPDTSITNYGFYTDGTNGFGTGIDVQYKVENSYGQPADITGGETGFSPLFNETANTPVALDGGTATVTATGDFGRWLVMYMSVASTASPGTTTGELLTFSWDEI